MKRLRPLLWVFALLVTLIAEGRPPRLIVLTDIGADPDDQQSLVRLLLYSNQIDIEGIVATTSCWQQNRVRPELVAFILDAYAKVQPNLLKHEAGFPTADALRALRLEKPREKATAGPVETTNDAADDLARPLPGQSDDP